MDLKRLANFVRVAELGSISRAADRMRIAQPALSRQMRLLEEEIGAQLFLRHRRGMQLTNAGEDLRLRISGPLRQLDQAFAEIRSASGQAVGQISVGLPPTVSYVLAGRLAQRVARQMPKVSLRIVEGYGGHLIDWLQRGEIDAAIFYGPASDFQMKVEELLIEELVLVGPPDSDLDPGRPLTVTQAAALPLVLPSHPHGLRVVVEHAAAKARAKLDIRFEADSFLVLKQLVLAGFGYTVLPLSSIDRADEGAGFRYTHLSKPHVVRQLVLGAQAEAHRSYAVRAIGLLIREEIASLVQQGQWRAQMQFKLDTKPGSAQGSIRQPATPTAVTKRPRSQRTSTSSSSGSNSHSVGARPAPDDRPLQTGAPRRSR